MNLVEYFVGLFKSVKVDQEALELVEESGKEVGREIAQVWLTGVDLGMEEIAAERRAGWIGRLTSVEPTKEELVLDVESKEGKPDYMAWTRPELMREAKSRGISYGRDVTKLRLSSKLRHDDSKQNV